MKKAISPTVTWSIVVVVVLLVVFLGFKYMAGPPPDPDKKGADEVMKKVRSGEPMYTPPPGANVPGGKSGGGSSGYNMRPPDR